jgi:hypothetical protein
MRLIASSSRAGLDPVSDDGTASQNQPKPVCVRGAVYAATGGIGINLHRDPACRLTRRRHADPFERKIRLQTLDLRENCCRAQERERGCKSHPDKIHRRS